MAVISTKKNLGAYFTPRLVATWLSEWALRSPSDRAFDPSLGDGIFLEAAINRIRNLGGDPASQVFGCEIDATNYHDARARLGALGFDAEHLHLGDFFSFDSTAENTVEAVIGNPPYIRYQRFNGDMRQRAIEVSKRAGVKINQLASSWAPFVVHSCEFLKPGGRLAMVIPFELTYANYARPVIDHLLNRFESVQVLTFRERIFPDIAEDTVLLLADGHGTACVRFEVVAYDGPQDLARRHPTSTSLVDITEWRAGATRLASALLSAEIRQEYLALSANASVVRLGAIATVDIGYVSGNKDFFHVSEETIRRYKLPKSVLRPALLNSRDLEGVEFTAEDFQRGVSAGKAAWLFYPDAKEQGKAVSAYIGAGETLGVQTAYKCRTRTPWWRVPFVYHCDAVLSVMSNFAPKMVFNAASAVVTNSLLTVRFRELPQELRKRQVAAYYNSLTQLSAEVEGHGMGGGALKLEPGEAEQVYVPSGAFLADLTEDVTVKIDQALRAGGPQAAAQVGDELILKRMLGFTDGQIERFRQGITLLQTRRRGK